MYNLQHLISAYFYELWDQHEYSSWEEAVDDFVRRSPERALSVPDEIDRLLAEVLNDADLAARLESWGLDVGPLLNERVLLVHIARRIRSDLRR